jgi:hypothetical protein
MKIADLLKEYTPSRTQFSQVLNDSGLKMGFECEVITDTPKYQERDDYDDWEEPEYDEMSWSELQNADGLNFSERRLQNIQEDFDEWQWKAKMAEWRSDRDSFIAQYCEQRGLDPNKHINQTHAMHEWVAETHDRFAETHDMDAYIQQVFGSNRKFLDEMGISIEPPERDDDENGEETNVNGVCFHVARSLERDLGLDFDSGDPPWEVVEDVSIQDDEYVGVEVVSGVYPIREGLDVMMQLFGWFRQHHFSTNRSTGLHVSFSIDGKARDDYDFLKMAVLFDENYTANLFRRIGNQYAMQMRSEIFNDLNGRDPASLLPSDRALTEIAAELKRFGRYIGIGNEKYYSFRHRANGVVEFRSMGGSGYEDKYDVIRKRIINMAFMMKIGSDPNLLVREYVKRVWQMITSSRFEEPKIVRQTPTVRGMATFAPLLARYSVEVPRWLRSGVVGFLAAFLGRLDEHDWANLKTDQVRELRYFIARNKITPEALLAAKMSHVSYNVLAKLMHWPVAVPGHPQQQTFPFARNAQEVPQAEPQPEREPYDWNQPRLNL